MNYDKITVINHGNNNVDAELDSIELELMIRVLTAMIN